MPFCVVDIRAFRVVPPACYVVLAVDGACGSSAVYLSFRVVENLMFLQLQGHYINPLSFSRCLRFAAIIKYRAWHPLRGRPPLISPLFIRFTPYRLSQPPYGLL